MFFWPAALFLSIASTAIIVFSLFKGGKNSCKSAELDIALYKQQLKELDREVNRGIVAPDEAEASKLEISRRILEADRISRGELPPKAAPAKATVACAVGVVALLIPGNLIIYQKFGSPGVPDLPQAKRIETAEKHRLNRPSQDSFVSNLSPRRISEEGFDSGYLDLVERLRDTVFQRPEDLQGLTLLARHEGALGNFAAAAEAMKKILALSGNRAGCDEYGDLAEYMVLGAEGYVSPEAEAALEACLSIDSGDSRSLYFLGLIHAQTGRPDLAFEIWRELLERGPHGARWENALKLQISDVAEMAGARFQFPTSSLPGPGADDIAAASEMDPEDRAAMIEGMVSGLESRLAEEGGSVDEWIRLIRSLGILGHMERAEEARNTASNAFSDNAELLEEIARAARESGLP